MLLCKVHVVRQVVAYLLAGLLAQAWIHDYDKPTSAYGFITNGQQWKIIVCWGLLKLTA